jgi:phage repressor protein C with HTH and peptisase S24 domain
MTASALSQLEGGQTKGVKPENLIALARRLGISPEELVTGQARNNLPKSGVNLRETPRAYRSFRDVPIVGNVIATPEGDGFFDDMGFPPGAGEAYLPWPTRDPNAYALRVKGDSMQPRIRPGEMLVVEPSVRAEPGADVVVRTRDGRKMVKQLLFRRGKEVTLGSVNIAHKQVTISVEEIESMHVVSAIVPRGANTKEDV